MNPPDERRGVPSASSMDRVMNCPASFDMERQITESEETEDAASGTRIHAVLALLASADTLNAAEIETCDMCAEQAQQVTAEWAGTDGFVVPDLVIREQRLGMTALGSVIEVTPDSTADFVFTGQADFVAIKAGRALVIDYKTGRGEYAAAVHNAQLASLAVLVWKRYKVAEVRVVIVQPWEGKPTVADYTTNALVLAEGWVKDTLLKASTSTPADLWAGEHCKWCKAAKAGVCPAFNDAQLAKVEVLNPITIAGMDGKGQRAAMFARAMELPAERLAATVRGLAMVERFVDAVKGAAKTRAADDPEFQQFYTLKEKAGRRSVNNVGILFSRCAVHGVSAEQFTAACSIAIGDTEDLLRKATGQKGKALKSTVSTLLADICDTGKPVMELVPVAALEGGDS